MLASQEWEKLESSYEKILKAVNSRNDTGRFRVIIFPRELNPYGQLSAAAVRKVTLVAEMTFDVDYYYYEKKQEDQR